MSAPRVFTFHPWNTGVPNCSKHAMVICSTQPGPCYMVNGYTDFIAITRGNSYPGTQIISRLFSATNGEDTWVGVEHPEALDNYVTVHSPCVLHSPHRVAACVELICTAHSRSHKMLRFRDTDYQWVAVEGAGAPEVRFACSRALKTIS